MSPCGGAPLLHLQSLFDELLQLADARGLLLRRRGAERERGGGIATRGGGRKPLPEELDHAALLTALQTL